MTVNPVRLAADLVDLLKAALTPVLARLAVLDDQVAAVQLAIDQGPGTDDVAALATDVMTLRDRLAILEARPPLPGPAGDPGAAGVGLAMVEYDGQRTFTFALTDGSRTVHTPPLAIYQGVYTAGRLYAVGDLVTASGNLWHCNAATTTPPGRDAAAWTLVVRRGRDARKGPTP